MVGSEKGGLGEQGQRGFASADAPDAHASLYALVLLGNGYRCALTGARFGPPTLLLHADLEVVAIQPREQGGPLALGNYLPMLASLAPVFRDGLITIADDLRIVVPHADLLDSALLAGLRSSLLVPDDKLFRPGAAFLAHHRRYALGR